MTFEWRFLHDSLKHVITVKNVRHLTLYLWQPWCPGAFTLLLFTSAYEILNAVASLLSKSLWLEVTWCTIYETRFSRPKNRKSGNDTINKLWSSVTMDDFKYAKVWKHMYFDSICNYSCFFGHQWKYYVEFRKMINSVTYIAILATRLTLHINQIDLKFQQRTTSL